MTAGRQPDEALLVAVQQALDELADPDRAPQMQAYMRSAMPFHGVPAALLRPRLRTIFAAHPPTDRTVWEATVRELWDGATHREERYAATALAGHRSARAWQDPAVLGLHRHLVVTGAWWDHVDEVANRLVGPVLRSHHAEVAPVLRQWATDDDLWLRRTAVIAQLGSKAETDTVLLADVIRANLLDGPPVTRDFFVRKAVGWALRQHARTDAGWVLAFVEDHRDLLSPLSVREATKHL